MDVVVHVIQDLPKVDNMSDICVPCKEAGFNKVAHYKGVPKGISPTGKEIPAMCYDHRNGTVPKHIQRQIDQKAAEEFIKKRDEGNGKEDKDTEVITDNERVPNPKVENKPIVRSDGNDYTSVTEFQINEIKEFRKLGLTNPEIAKKLKIKLWRVQKISSDLLDKKDTYIPEEKHKHIRVDAIINAPELSKEEYNKKYGELGKRKMSQSTIDLWDRVKDLPMGNVLILPMKENESTNNSRGRYQNILQRCIRTFKPSFKIRLVGVQEHRHIVLFKVKE